MVFDTTADEERMAACDVPQRIKLHKTGINPVDPANAKSTPTEPSCIRVPNFLPALLDLRACSVPIKILSTLLSLFCNVYALRTRREWAAPGDLGGSSGVSDTPLNSGSRPCENVRDGETYKISFSYILIIENVCLKTYHRYLTKSK